MNGYRITGDTQTIATSTTASATELSTANKASDWLLIQNNAAAAGAFISFRLGGSGADADGKGAIIHGGQIGILVKREALDTHIGWDASAGTPNLLVTPVNPF